MSRAHVIALEIRQSHRYDISGGVEVSSFLDDEARSDRMVNDLDGIIKATDKLIGGPLRRELITTVSLEEIFSLKRKKRDREIPVVIENKPFYVVDEDNDVHTLAEWSGEDRKVMLRVSERNRNIPFRDFMHELGHGIYKSISQEYFVKFSELYFRLLNKFISRVSSGYDHLIAAERICSQQFFLDSVDPKEQGFICWQGLVHQDYEPFDSDKRDMFHRVRKIPRIHASRIRLDPEEAFAEFFAYYHHLRRRPLPYKIVPDPQRPKQKKMQKDLYEFGAKYMRQIIRSAKPHSRKERTLV